MLLFLLLCLFGATSQAAPVDGDRPKLDAYLTKNNAGRSAIHFHYLKKGTDFDYSDTITFTNGKSKSKIFALVEVRLVKSEPTKKASEFRFPTKNGGFAVVQADKPEDHSPETWLRYDVFFSQGTPYEEVAATTWKLFARDKHYTQLTTNLEGLSDILLTSLATPDFGRADDLLLTLQEGVTISEPVLLKVAQSTQPKTLWLETKTKVLLSDAFFRDPIVKKVKNFAFWDLDTDLMDDTLATLDADEFTIQKANKLTQKGLRRWLERVINGEASKRYFTFNANFKPDKHFVDGLKAKARHSEGATDDFEWIVERKKTTNGKKYAVIYVNEGVDTNGAPSGNFNFRALETDEKP